MLKIDSERYAYTRTDHAACVDIRHTNILFNVIMRCQFHKILEVGSLDGSTAVAYIEALERGKEFELHLCDLHIRPALQRLIDECPHRQRIFVHNKCSWSVIDTTFDFVFVDGDHRLDGAGRDLDRLLACATPTVAAHDTNATRSGIPDCEGAQLLGRVYERLNGYQTFVDQEIRPYELTHRGFMVSTRDQTAGATIAEIFREWQ